MKFRIVYNGYKYKIQAKTWLSWRNMGRSHSPFSFTVSYFDTKEEALEHLNEVLDEYKKDKAKWQTVHVI